MMKKIICMLLVSLLSCILLMTGVQAQNPIFPPGLYIADPSSHVWNDGKLYIYGFA